MARPNHRVTTVIRSIVRETERINSYELADPDDWNLPPFTAGAHIDVHFPDGLIRQYSLCGDPAVQNRYRIAVQKEPEGRGGSVYAHEHLKVGDLLHVSLPRNHFPLVNAGAPSVFIAGGIGITPLLSMLGEAIRTGGDCMLHFAVRDRKDIPFRSTIETLVEQGRARVYAASDGRRLDIGSLFESAPPHAHFYCCGPERMNLAFRQAAGGWPGAQVHFEHFGAAPRATKHAYTIELARSGQRIPVSSEETMLSALRRAGIEIEASCEAGVCLLCKTRYLEGSVEHRDLLMTNEDRLTYLTPCVSHCAGRTIVLDI